jgi:hypothetical protein
MNLKYHHLSQHPTVFKSLTGLRLVEFEALRREVVPLLWAADQARAERPDRQRAPGAGHPYALSEIDQLLLTVIWLRQYPTYEVLGYLFGISDTSAGRAIKRVLPLLEQTGRDTMRMPDPGRKRRRSLDELLAQTPDLVVLVDSFEQRVQRPQVREEADRYYSGKKKQHTLKVQVAVDELTGAIVDISPSVRGPTADLTLLKQSAVLAHLPAGVGVLGDLAYIGLAKLLPDEGLALTPRRKPRGQERPAEDIAFNTAVARRRVTNEHTIGRLRRFQALSQTDRHHRQLHHARTVAVAGLVNRQLRHRFALAA